jgi:carboxypeptidase family protein
MKMTKRIVPAFLSLFISLFLSAGQVYGQGATSRVTGTVVDTTGATVPGATVNLTNEANGVSFTTQSGGSGAYAFDLIPAGVYRVSAEKSGFKKIVSTGNVVQINQPATVNVMMEMGDVSSQVTVQATAEAVQTSSSGNIGSTEESNFLARSISDKTEELRPPHHCPAARLDSRIAPPGFHFFGLRL